MGEGLKSRTSTETLTTTTQNDITLGHGNNNTSSEDKLSESAVSLIGVGQDSTIHEEILENQPHPDTIDTSTDSDSLSKTKPNSENKSIENQDHIITQEI